MGDVKLRQVIISLTGCIFLLSCAQISAPEGGPKDEDAPVIDEKNSTPGEQVFFDDRKIELTFDEWIQLSNPSKEVFVSPPLDYPPKVTARGKKVTFEFSESEILKDSTTYQINFGKAIKDLRAGNEVENLIFLFSTGATIDQFSIKGSVVDAQSGKPLDDIVVMLYDNLNDSCFTTIKPLYLARTDKEGLFELKNLRSDTFQLFALKDENVSYTYDVSSELVGFHDSLIIVQDTLMEEIVLELFDEADPPRLIQAKQVYQGLANIIYQPIPLDYELEFLEETPKMFFHESFGDTIKLWHDSTADSLMLLVKSPTMNDTIILRKSKNVGSEVKMKLVSKSVKGLATDTFRIRWSLPLDSLNMNRIRLSDTVSELAFSEFGWEEREFWFKANLQSASQYSLTIDSASVKAWSGTYNSDSLDLVLTTLDPERFGNINLKIIQQDTLSYLMDVMQAEDKLESYELNGQTLITVPQLAAGKYLLRLTQDVNGDGKWTAGNLKEKRKPEIIKELTLEDLKAGWDLEATVDIQEIFYAVKGK